MKNALNVLDSEQEDEVPQSQMAASKRLDMSKNPSLVLDDDEDNKNNNNGDDSAIFKHQFLECVAQGSDVKEKEIGNLDCVDGGAIECCEDANENAHPGTGGDGEGDSGGDNELGPNFPTQEEVADSETDENVQKYTFNIWEENATCNEAAMGENSQLDAPNLDPSLEGVLADAKLDGHEHVNQSTLSGRCLEIVEGEIVLDGHTSDGCCCQPVEHLTFTDGGTNILADYVSYRDKWSTGCVITFLSDGIKINASTSYEGWETFSFEKGIEDIIKIESEHVQRCQIIKVKLIVLSVDTAQGDDACGVSAVEELEFAVVENTWSEKWKEITSLNVKYLAMRECMEAAIGGGPDLPERPYFPIFDEVFEEVVYPKGDIDAVSISKRDVDLLQPETFINDTIIDFYIKYLKNEIPSEEKPRFHFFNSFFFRKLADLDKDPSSASDGRAAFLRVRKWTRRVDIFGKDYIIIPVNFNLHWSLLVICHPGDVATFRDEDSEKSLRVPCILHMDSIKGTHAGLRKLVQSYLWEEWKDRQNGASEDLSSKFLNLRFVPLELPQQENSFDCGLFLLHFLELFLTEAPQNFSPFRINKLSKFLTMDWFTPVEASLKRTNIQRLIFKLLENRSSEASSEDDESESNIPGTSRNEIGVEFVSERYSPTVPCHGNFSNFEAGQGIEMTLLEASSMRNSQCINDPGLVLREFFDQGVSAGTLLANCSSFDQQSSYYRPNGAMSQMEDDAETEQQFMCFSSGDIAFQQIASLTAQDGSIPYSLRAFAPDAQWNSGFPADEDDSSSQPSTSDDSDVGIIEDFPIKEEVVLSQKDKFDQRRSSSMENMECLTDGLASASSEMLEASAVEDSEDPDRMQHCNGSGELAAYEENLAAPGDEEPKAAENDLPQYLEKAVVTSGDGETPDGDTVAESDEQPAAKRLRLTPLEEGDRGVTDSPVEGKAPFVN